MEGLTESAMSFAGPSLGQNQEMFELFILVQLAFLIGRQAVRFFLSNQFPNAPLGGFRWPKALKGVSRDFPSKKFDHFIYRAHRQTIVLPVPGGKSNAF